MENQDLLVQNAINTDEFLIAGIGASAGGIKALKEFFVHVPIQSGIAYVVILHLSPHHDSKLAEVLQTVTSIPVLQVRSKTKIASNHIFVVAPNQHLNIKEGYIVPSDNTTIEDRRAPVDILFRSLADIYGFRSVCVILSGTGADGSMGLKRIKERGGALFAQHPEEAEFSEMPRNAIATELIDQVLPVADIPEKIIAYRTSLNSNTKNSVSAPARAQLHDNAFEEIIKILRTRTGHDFANYKRPTLLRRIERRTNIQNLPDIPSYVAYLKENNEEVFILLKNLLISVTNFFRDSKLFSSLEQEALPKILAKKKPDDQVRIWVAGCATGEEAYSIAILLAEKMAFKGEPLKVQIFATDIDEAAIAVAREGFYTINDVADVSPERLQRYFTPEEVGYRINRGVREMVIFAAHNVLKDSPFSRLDLVACRNVLIYFNTTAQERVLQTFHFALNRDGFLFLGSSESVDGARDLFSTISRDGHLFQANEVAVRNWPIPEASSNYVLPKKEPSQKLGDKESHKIDLVSFGELHQKLLEQYAPPSLLINEEFDVVHMSEKVGRYLEFKGGEPSKNLLKIIKSELRFELRVLVHQALQNRTAITGENVKVIVNGQEELLTIQVRPVMQEHEPARGFLLVLFQRDLDLQKPINVIQPTNEAVANQLEEELNQVKTQLRSSIQQYEFQTEELKASNEELQAMNEELRSAAEELETGKEELQSINEELQTVNQELKVKIEEVSITSNNLENLISSADIGTIFLDRNFLIRLFTPAVLQIFNLKPSDLGRPVSDITNKLLYDLLLLDAGIVLEKLTNIEHEVTTTDNRTFIMRLLPYRTVDDRINGVVITFFDITSRKLVENALQRSEEYLRLVIESAQDYAIFTLDLNHNVVSWSIGASLISGYSEAEIVGKTADVLYTTEDLEVGAPKEELEKAEKEGRAENARWHVRKDGSRFWGSGSVSPLRDDSGRLVGFVKILRDLTETRRLEAAKFFLASIVETSNDSIITIDFAKKITSWNKAAEELYGYTSEEAIGSSLTMLTLPQDLLEILGNIYKVEHSGQVARFDTIRVHKDGYEIDLEIVLSPVKNSLQQVIGVSTIARNITERKRREANLAFLAQLDQDFAPMLTVEQVMAGVGLKLAKQLKLSRFHLSLVDLNANRLNVVYEWRQDEQSTSLLGTQLISEKLTETGIEQYILGKLAIIDANRESPFLKDIRQVRVQLGGGSIVEVPGMVNGNWKFLLSIVRHELVWRADELELIDEVASRIFIRIQRAYAEEALRVSEERFRTLTDAIPQVIWANNEKGEANFFNQRWFQYTGLTYEESFGVGWEAIVHPDDGPKSIETWKKALKEGHIFDTEYRLRNKEGKYCWFIGRNIPYKDNTGKVLEWFGSATNIEKLKEAQQLLRNMSDRLHIALEAGQLGSFEYDFELKKVYGTAKWNEIYGYAADQSLTNDSILSIVNPEDRQKIEIVIKQAISEGGVFNVEYRIEPKQGGIRWVKSSGRVLFDENKKPLKLVGIALDFTEQKLFTEELTRLVSDRTHELQKSNDSLRQFAHVASHDLKEPVRKIKVFINRLKDQFSNVFPEKAMTYLLKVESSTDRMISMIDGILSYSLLSRADNFVEQVNLHSIMNEIESLLEVLMQAKNAVIKRSLLPTVCGNSTLIFQLFYNLVLNSLKFSKTDEPSIIDITSSMISQNDREYAKITLSDNGIGFEEKYKDVIFDTFSRLNPLNEYEGTGLGLALCKQIVERHGGEIWADGQLNKGATFTLLLPTLR
ncbi:PAS domain S-box protein [Segetibacter sp. 3557_3]|uniref:PAS domain S-box protein n=1 Tax=Segetibacter sp. 3557_3 TaxID=2547429 RepID=UPI0010590758|nr:PAS domain S-box protein [Segetibacter sp. 3557_3]TDH17792.1 PAS domain S-box protein [Segetibacter sp. 3557_3]